MIARGTAQRLFVFSAAVLVVGLGAAARVGGPAADTLAMAVVLLALALGVAGVVLRAEGDWTPALFALAGLPCVSFAAAPARRALSHADASIAYAAIALGVLLLSAAVWGGRRSSLQADARESARVGGADAPQG